MPDTRICLVGNSHLASLKLAVTQRLYDPSGIDVTFWGAPDGKFKAVTVKDGCLRAPSGKEETFLEVSDGRCAVVDPAKFDAIVLHGLDLHVTEVLQDLIRSSRTTDMSGQYLVDALTDWLLGRQAFALAKGLAVSGTPILLSHCPLHDETSGTFDGLDVPSQMLALVFGSLQRAALDHGLSFVAQPAATIRDNKYTDREYSKGSVKLARLDEPREHMAREFKHMNPRYGAEVLRTAVSMVTDVRQRRQR
jgi:hypothetical protein